MKNLIEDKHIALLSYNCMVHHQLNLIIITNAVYENQGINKIVEKIRDIVNNFRRSSKNKEYLFQVMDEQKKKQGLNWF